MSKHHKYNKYHHNNRMNDKNTFENEKEQPITPDEMAEIAETPETSETSKSELEVSQEYEELKESNLRLLAEFDNFRKRTIRERTELLKTASEGVLKDILPLVDDFERAKTSMENTQDIDAVRQGVELIYQKFIKFLYEQGVKEIPTENADFDTEFHEAITLFPAPADEQKGKIIDCISKGYTLNDKVIRFAKVVVGE